MTITYSLAPIPKWYIADNTGRPAGGCKMYTKRQLNKTQDKPVYQDPAGAFPYTNPVIFDLNGTEGPFYWKFDSTMADDLYYLRFEDSNGNFLFDIENFSPATTGGGVTTTNVNLQNYVANNVFWRNIGTSATPVPTSLTVCPSNHEAFEYPDMLFGKTATANSDTITFTKFPLGSDPLGSDLTPNWFMRYQCTTNVPGETEKHLQIPIIAKVNNMDNTTVTVVLWTKNDGIGGNVSVQLYQFMGFGGAPSADVLTATQLITVSATWTKSILTFVVPSVSGKTLGTCDNDGLYLRINYPLSQASDISIAKPALYIGNIQPGAELESYDMSNTVIAAPRTGSKINGYMLAPLGYLSMNDGTIGTTGSGASVRANPDTYFLFKTIYATVIDTYAPVSGGRSGNSATDFAAGKTLRFPFTLGRVRGNAGQPSSGGTTNWAVGQNGGIETQSVGIGIANMPSHDHPGSFMSRELTGQGGGGLPIPATPPGTGPVSITIAPQGGGAPLSFSVIQPSAYENEFIKL